ncbi:bifunctional alpha,alpha-trehalose-phosphate synthase (UDP-forming)/trehalose-phosphatase [Verrucomicrobiales bacterium]|nr:bifunctional alpha,alpha-trehalose-phosphate synthase (UDP-forming)/trehalose-phosphatase [Verrucomicrobiales bacterium]
MSRTILVSNRLPVRMNADGQPERTTGGLASALQGIGGSDSLWIGWPGVPSEEIDNPAELEKTLAKIGVAPVMMNAELLDGFYEGYSNSTLWPVLHSMLERARFDKAWFDIYRQANISFAETVLSHVGPGDTVWIHDYHLFLLPALLREGCPGLKIGFFLHTPFPSSEAFRAVPGRQRILRGLLGVDLIGFHTYNYQRHFRSALLRLLGIETEIDSLRYGGRTVHLGVFPIGHDRDGFHKTMESEAYRTALAEQKAQLKDRSVVLSVERLDYTKGVPQKLEAIRTYLENHPESSETTVFVIVAVPSRQGVNEYDQLTEQVQREVGAINGAFGTFGNAPVQFLHRGFPLAELAALYARADVCLVTPLIDGMNLVAKEFIDCKRPEHGATPGVLVLSEFAGAAQEMSHAILVNPYDALGVANAIHLAVKMSAKEKDERTEVMQDRLSRNHAGVWAKRFLTRLDEVCSDGSAAELETDLTPVAISFRSALADGKQAALFLDYDGTLRDFVDRPEDAIPDANLPGLLRSLAEIEGLHVAVVSGRPADFLEKHLGGLGLTLVAEHGYRWLRAGVDVDWQLVNPMVDNSWKDTVRPPLDLATTLTPGSRVEEKKSALVWHYRAADPEFGLWRARGLLSELTDTAANLPVSVHHGKKIVEIASQMVNKGVATDFLMRDWDTGVALAVGDDQTDETMFMLEPPETIEFHTVHIGVGSSRAGHRSTIPGFRRFLEDLAADLRK